MAPSWKNSQTTRWYAVESPEKLEQLRLALHAVNQQKAANADLIVSTYVRDIAGFTNGKPDNEVGNGWGAYDLGLHDAYLILAAKDAGYDTLIMGLRDADKVRSILGIPEEEEILSVIAIGKRAEEPALRPRKPLEDIAKFY
jgi:nitroreductase